MPARERLQRAEREAAVAARTAVPALITGGAGDDPAGVVTYTVVGATTGFSQLWLLLLSTPLLWQPRQWRRASLSPRDRASRR